MSAAEVAAPALRSFPPHAARVRALMVPFPAAAGLLGLAETTARRNVEDREDGSCVLVYGRHELEVVKATERKWKVPVADLSAVTGLSVNDVFDALSGEDARSEAGAA